MATEKENASSSMKTPPPVVRRATWAQGAPESGWILLDYGDIIVHVMTPKSRSYYDLDTYWAAGERVDLSAVVTPNVAEAEVPPAEEVVSGVLALGACGGVASGVRLGKGTDRGVPSQARA